MQDFPVSSRNRGASPQQRHASELAKWRPIALPCIISGGEGCGKSGSRFRAVSGKLSAAFSRHQPGWVSWLGRDGDCVLSLKGSQDPRDDANSASRTRRALRQCAAWR